LPSSSRAPAHPIAVIAPDAERAALAHAVSATHTLRPVTAHDPDDALPSTLATLATLRLAGSELTIEDLAGRCSRRRATPTTYPTRSNRLVNLGLAQARARSPASTACPAPRRRSNGASHEAAWPMRCRITARSSAPATGSTFASTIRPERRFVQHRQPRRARHGHPAHSTARPDRVALAGGARLTLGERDGRLTGSRSRGRAACARQRTADRRADRVGDRATVDLRGLETREPTRAEPAMRSAVPAMPRDALFVKRLSYALHPRAAAP